MRMDIDRRLSSFQSLAQFKVAVCQIMKCMLLEQKSPVIKERWQRSQREGRERMSKNGR
jgi:hypothetical protein